MLHALWPSRSCFGEANPGRSRAAATAVSSRVLNAAGMRAIPLVAPATTRTIGLVWPDRDPESILARALLDVASGVDLVRSLQGAQRRG